ncbi:hypothetical protein PSI23_20650 [Xenorhabdus sp. XENO-10]|uniref:Uncharacterized protein n=1 Tax=Xenorhabdus yunnanensis TaxID=3025878 RepID=A0ABT5LKI8_9GAMM|nr:hypothetical protein [Xenorhabdus yunnanensis]MDC9591622.1 hypothetical protein [Xenorhabdus yunnanensis]
MLSPIPYHYNKKAFPPYCFPSPFCAGYSIDVVGELVGVDGWKAPCEGLSMKLSLFPVPAGINHIIVIDYLINEIVSQ